MLQIKRGSLVYLLFPNEESKGKDFSVKLAIVLSINDSSIECAMVPCTSQTHQIHRYDMSFIIKKNSTEGKSMNLKSDSIIIVDRFLANVPIAIIQSIHNGIAPESVLIRIEKILGL